MPTTIESTGENERAQAERWARNYEGHATWAMLMPEERAERIAAMLPLVRDARKPIDDAHVALDVEVPRQVNGRTLSLVERAAILLQGQAYASDLFDKASDERDAARREIEQREEREGAWHEATGAHDPEDYLRNVARATPSEHMVKAIADDIAAALPDDGALTRSQFRTAVADAVAKHLRAPAPLTPDADERAQAERWGRIFIADDGAWAEMSAAQIDRVADAMLPLVREARAAVDRVVDGLSVAVSDGPRLLSKVQAERDTALREIERLKSDLAEAHVSRGWMLDMRTAPLTEAARTVSAALSDHVATDAPMSADECARLRDTLLRATPAPLTEASHGPPEDEALRWAEDVLDAAKPPEEADLDMSAAARAISPLVREAQVARRAPLTEDEARGFYVRDSRSYVGNCVLWWAKGRSGYTTHLDEAHVFTEEEAAAAQRNRETDVAMPVRAARAAASMQVDAQRLSRGDIPGDVRAAKEGAK